MFENTLNEKAHHHHHHCHVQFDCYFLFFFSISIFVIHITLMIIMCNSNNTHYSFQCLCHHCWCHIISYYMMMHGKIKLWKKCWTLNEFLARKTNFNFSALIIIIDFQDLCFVFVLSKTGCYFHYYRWNISSSCVFVCLYNFMMKWNDPNSIPRNRMFVLW